MMYCKMNILKTIELQHTELTQYLQNVFGEYFDNRFISTNLLLPRLLRSYFFGFPFFSNF